MRCGVGGRRLPSRWRTAATRGVATSSPGVWRPASAGRRCRPCGHVAAGGCPRWPSAVCVLSDGRSASAKAAPVCWCVCRTSALAGACLAVPERPGAPDRGVMPGHSVRGRASATLFRRSRGRRSMLACHCCGRPGTTGVKAARGRQASAGQVRWALSLVPAVPTLRPPTDSAPVALREDAPCAEGPKRQGRTASGSRPRAEERRSGAKPMVLPGLCGVGRSRCRDGPSPCAVGPGRSPSPARGKAVEALAKMAAAPFRRDGAGGSCPITDVGRPVPARPVEWP